MDGKLAKKRSHFKEQEIVEGGQGSQYSLSYHINVMNYLKRVHENKVGVGSCKDTREVGLGPPSIIRPSQRYRVRLQGWEKNFYDGAIKISCFKQFTHSGAKNN